MSFLKTNKKIFILSVVFLFIAIYLPVMSQTRMPVSKIKVEGIPLNLQEMVNVAQRVFIGKCIETREEDFGTDIQDDEYTFEVKKSYYGITDKDVIIRHSKLISDDIKYEKGKEYLLFLLGDSKLGVTSPVGFGSGVFNIKEEKWFFFFTKKSVINQKGNRGLERNLRTNREVKIENNPALNDKFHKLCTEGKPIELKDFEKVLDYLYKNKNKDG